MTLTMTPLPAFIGEYLSCIYAAHVEYKDLLTCFSFLQLDVPIQLLADLLAQIKTEVLLILHVFVVFLTHLCKHGYFILLRDLLTALEFDREEYLTLNLHDLRPAVNLDICLVLGKADGLPDDVLKDVNDALSIRDDLDRGVFIGCVVDERDVVQTGFDSVRFNDVLDRFDRVQNFFLCDKCVVLEMLVFGQVGHE